MVYGSDSNGTYKLRGTAFSRHPGTGVRLLEVTLEDERSSRITHRFSASDGSYHSYWDGNSMHPASPSDFAEVYHVLDSAGFFGNRGLDQSVKQIRGAIRKRGAEQGLVPVAERPRQAASVDELITGSCSPPNLPRPFSAETPQQRADEAYRLLHGCSRR